MICRRLRARSQFPSHVGRNRRGSPGRSGPEFLTHLHQQVCNRQNYPLRFDRCGPECAALLVYHARLQTTCQTGLWCRLISPLDCIHWDTNCQDFSDRPAADKPKCFTVSGKSRDQPGQYGPPVGHDQAGHRSTGLFHRAAAGHPAPCRCRPAISVAQICSSVASPKPMLAAAGATKLMAQDQFGSMAPGVAEEQQKPGKTEPKYHASRCRPPRGCRCETSGCGP